MHCSTCGAVASATAHFCSACGAPLVAPAQQGGVGASTVEAAGGAPDGGAATAATGAPPSAPASLDSGVPDWLRRQLTAGAWVLLAIVAVASVTVILSIAGLAVLGSGSSSASSSSSGSGGGSLTDLLTAWVQSFAMPLFGGLRVSATSVEGEAHLVYNPLVPTVALCVLTYWLSQRAVGTATTTREVARDAAVTAALPVVVVAVLTVLMPVSTGPVRASADLVWMVPFGFVLLFAVGLLARARRRPQAWGRLRPWVESAQVRRAGAALSGHLATLAAILACTAVIYLLLEVGVVKTFGSLLLGPLLGGNALVVAAGLAHGGSFTAGFGVGPFAGTQTVSLFSNGTPAWAWLLLVAALLASVVGGLRVGLGMPLGWHRQWRDLWVTPVAFFVVWTGAFVAFGRAALDAGLTGIPLFGSVNAAFSVAVAPATGLLVALWGLVVEVTARVAAPATHRLFPVLARLLVVRPWGRPGQVEAATGAAGSPAAVPEAVAPTPGIQVTEPVPVSAPPLGSAHPLTPQQRRRLTFWGVLVGGLCAVSLAAILALRWLGSTYFGPTTVVEQYLAYLKAGDASAANALADPGVPNALRAGLSNSVLAAASARPDSVIVGEPTVADTTATVPVQFSVDGQKVTTSMSAERSGSTFLVFPTWRLTSTLAQPVAVSSWVGVNISGTDVAAPGSDASDESGQSGTTTYLYPGTYTVTGAKGAPIARWVTPTVAPLTVTGSGTRAKSVSVTASAAPALTDEVNARMKALVDSCAATGRAEPTSDRGKCPFSTYSSDDKATWKVVSYPRMKVETNSYSQAMYATTDKAGSVQVTTSGFFGPSTDTRSISPSSQRVTFAADGTVSLGS